MWFNFIKNYSPQSHRGTEKTFTFVIPAQAGIHFIKLFKVAGFRVKHGMTRFKVFSVPLCLCGEAFELFAVFKVRASQP
jgi:hypothetical protein